MGVYIHLRIRADRVNPEAWHRVYEESWQVLRAYPNEPMTLDWRTVAGERIPMYQRGLQVTRPDGTRCWRVTGDMRTKHTAESFDFPERFGAATSSELPDEEDVLVELASDSETRCSTLFGNKTQSQPYHTLIVAIATLVENRFPGVAVVTGDLSRRDGQDACDLLQRALHEDFRPPVVLDAARMRDRLLPVLGAQATEQAIERLAPPEFCSLAADLLGILESSPRERFRTELESSVSYSDPLQVSATLRDAIALLVASLKSMAHGFELASRLTDSTGAMDRNRALASIAQATPRKGLYFTEDAWHSIESAPDETLHFLTALSLSDCNEWHRWHLARALFESEAVRHFAMLQWKTLGVP